jgi:hypothetical protein
LTLFLLYFSRAFLLSLLFCFAFLLSISFLQLFSSFIAVPAWIDEAAAVRLRGAWIERTAWWLCSLKAARARYCSGGAALRCRIDGRSGLGNEDAGFGAGMPARWWLGMVP